MPVPVKYNGRYKGRLLKSGAIAIIYPDTTADDLRNALLQSLNMTFPIIFQDQIPGKRASRAKVQRWIKLWFLEQGKSSTRISKLIKSLPWNGRYLWKHGERQIQQDLKALGIPKAYSDSLGRDIVAARRKLDGGFATVSFSDSSLLLPHILTPL
jgi:hypothetical protein